MEENEVLEKIEKASNEEYITEWDNEGKISTQKKKSEIEKGKKSRSSGAKFENLVRKDLEDKGWIADKWSNNVDLDLKKVISAKRKFNPFSKVMTIGTGFPDFIAFQLMGENFYKVIGVEVKLGGFLDKEEKEKCAWYLENKIFSEILVAKKNKDGLIEYVDVRKILDRMR
jgi:hypothetical protein